MIKELWRQIQTQLFEAHLLLIGILPAPLLPGLSLPSARTDGQGSGERDEPGREGWEMPAHTAGAQSSSPPETGEALHQHPALVALVPPQSWESSNLNQINTKVVVFLPRGPFSAGAQAVGSGMLCHSLQLHEASFNQQISLQVCRRTLQLSWEGRGKGQGNI